MFKYFPCGKDKKPLFDNWQELATDNPEQLTAWYHQYQDRFGYWGLPTGKRNGILALDIDMKDGKNGYESLSKVGVQCPTTMSQRSITGGMHLLYKYPQDNDHYGNRAGLFHKGSGVDIRGEGGYICVYNLDTSPLNDAPEWLAKESKGFVQSFDTHGVAGMSDGVALSELYQAIDNIKNAVEGERNQTLNTEAFKAARAVLASGMSVEGAKSMLRKAALDIGLGSHETEATLNSAFRGGESKPILSPFGAPNVLIDIPEIPKPEIWTPKPLDPLSLRDKSKLKRPQLFKDWSTRDIHITTADGGTGKSTMKLQEAVCLAIGAPFLGFACMVPEGRTLFITAEDTSEKLTAMVGQICEDMGILDNHELMSKVLNNIYIKTDSDLCLINKTRDGFLSYNKVALDTIVSACDEIKPDLIVFDPIASFWGSESALNDMASAVSKFMRDLMKHTNACVEMINHIGKVSSGQKDMSQFAGRGGTGLPSHSRVSKALRPLDDGEYFELTGEQLADNESCNMVNINKFTDGSPYLNKPFLVIRRGYVFTRKDIPQKQTVTTSIATQDQDRLYSLVKQASEAGRELTTKQAEAILSSDIDKIPVSRVKTAIEVLLFNHKISLTEHPDALVKDKVIILKA